MRRGKHKELEEFEEFEEYEEYEEYQECEECQYECLVQSDWGGGVETTKGLDGQDLTPRYYLSGYHFHYSLCSSLLSSLFSEEGTRKPSYEMIGIWIGYTIER